jgi:protocatechuate 3,4-dioxygenase beta subunit
VIDPGPGVATFFPAATIDTSGNLAFSWMESSSTEYVSMWVGAISAVTGQFSSYDAAPGQGFMPESFREGDYGSVVLDPNGTTFWAANEYCGSNPFSDIWNTHITSFSLPPAVNNDWYTINVAAGNTLTLQTYIPSTQGGQYPNADPVISIQLYDTFGNLVASSTQNADGHNATLTYTASISGQYHVLVSNEPGTTGEYFLQVSTPAYAAGGITGDVYNDLNGNGVLDPGDPGLDNWVVEVFNSSAVMVASQVTHAGGTFDFEGLTPGSYTVKEVLQTGWTLTSPPAPGSFTVAVTAGGTASGRDFGNFQNITLSGDKFNDLNGDGVQESGEPGLANWTIQLLNSAGAVVATTKTDANGNYRFANVGPGTYTVREVQQTGWTQTAPASGTYTVAATSGQNVGGLAFGDFKLVSYSGTVYNDLNGNGVMDSGEKKLNKWTIQLYDMMGNLVTSQTTNGTGTYSFANLGPGQWTIKEVLQTGWYQTQPGPPSYSYIIAASSGTNQSGLNFGDFQLVSLTGQVYNDLNGDGKKQGKEPGLSGWTVNLLNPSGNVVASAVSDSSGNYAFNSVFPGTFTIAEVLQSGWTQTQPVNPPVYTVTTQSGQNVSGLLFGDHKAASKSPATIVSGQAGSAQTGTLSTAAGGFNSGAPHVVLNNAAKNGDYVDANGAPSLAHGASQSLGSASSNTSTGGDASIGTLDFSGLNGASGSKRVSTTGQPGRSMPTVSINGLTQASALTVMYSPAAPLQGNAISTAGLIDLVLSQNNNTPKKDKSDVIASLALGLLSGKRVIA